MLNTVSRKYRLMLLVELVMQFNLMRPKLEQCLIRNEDYCFRMMENEYKFYISFENSVCKDYVTEKFMKIARYNIVPIVLGGADYERLAPAKSYINVMDFKSPAHLAEYLKYLDSNDTAYAEYFEWKQHFRIAADDRQFFCQICK